MTNLAGEYSDGCLFEEGFQWQMGIRGVDRGAVRNCVTHDIGRGFRAFNGVAGAMFFRCKNWVFENSEWGFIDIGLGSGDGEAFDFEGSTDNMTMRNCLFHDTDGPDFMAPIVSRTTRKARLLVRKTTKGNPFISEFEAYNDTTGSLPLTDARALVGE